MKSIKTISASLVFLSFLSGCVSKSSVRDVLIKNPDVVFDVIEKNPEQFMAVVQNASNKARNLAAEREMEEAFKNPLQPVIEKDRPIFGDAEAPVTVIEYVDFQCPYCQRGHETMKKVRETYGDKVRFIVKHLPLNFHPMAQPASRYFEAVAMQDVAKAVRFQDEVFSDQAGLGKDKEAFLKKAAEKAGADMARLKKELESPLIARRIEADMEEAGKFGITGTPGYLINGVRVSGARPYKDFEKIIDRHLGLCRVPSEITDK